MASRTALLHATHVYGHARTLTHLPRPLCRSLKFGTRDFFALRHAEVLV
ncbi:MAG: hypothetical protein HY650_02245 [Acidobacteria bacterium]|nr:hypothetical protein [Acidobacteriota bacterium]